MTVPSGSHGVKKKERSQQHLRLKLVPKAGLYKGGLLTSLIGAAISLLQTVSSLSPL